jgi:hypothetical protein
MPSMSALFLVAALASAPVTVPSGAVRATAQVLAFSEDGTEALVEERLLAPGGVRSIAYTVVDASGTVVRAPISQVTFIAGQLYETAAREACREGAAALERALGGFRTVRVHEAGCAMRDRDRAVVRLTRTPPSPVTDIKELATYREITAGTGTVWVSEDGPLVVLVLPEPKDPFGAGFAIRTTVRDDPRIHDRWPSPFENE